jgi:cytidine deaminase
LVSHTSKNIKQTALLQNFTKEAYIMDQGEPDIDLINAAIAIQSNAYAPYSHFNVGAAIRDEHGHIHSGVNVENAAYPQGQCAEASAIGAMIVAGAKRIDGIAVVGGDTGSDLLCTPCGGCRQKIREFAESKTPIYVCTPDGHQQTFTLDELLPSSFGPDNLE